MIRIKKNRVYDLSILFLFISIIALRKITGIMYIAQIIFLIAMTLKIKDDGFQINYYIIFSYMFLIWAIVSIFWSEKPQSTIKVLIPLIQITIVGIFFIQYYKNNSIDKILKFFCISSLVLTIFIILNTSISTWLEIIKETSNASTSAGRLGPSVGYQPNGLGIVLSFSALIWLYFISKNKSKISVSMYTILFVLVIFTKSRKSLIILLGGSIMYYILYKKRDFKKKISMVLITVFAIALSLWAILNIPFLYKVVGFRMVGLFSIFDPTYVADASVLTRDNMIDVAMTLFNENPIKGVGFGNYSYYYYHKFGGWAETYSHNNYAEVLSCLGIIGFILYYTILFRILYITLLKGKILKKYDRKLYALILTIIVMRLITDYGMVVYDDDFIQLLTITLYCNIYRLNLITINNNLNKEFKLERERKWISHLEVK